MHTLGGVRSGMDARVVVVDTTPALLLPVPSAAPTPPASRVNPIPRLRLVRALTAAADARVALVVAPAGYGKSTLLAEWAMRDERPFLPLTARSRLAGPCVLVLEDAHREDPARLCSLLESAASLPLGTTVAIVSRSRPPGPIGRLRAHRLLVELTAEDLAMTGLEAAQLVEAAGTRVGAAGLDRLLRKTRGWPAALYLAASTVAEAADPEAALARWSGADHTVAEFLREDVLSALSPAERVFLRRTAILGEVDAAACDAVLGGRGSGAVLRALHRHGVPMTALDDAALTFAYHPLLVESQRAERSCFEPEREAELHRRAAHHHAGTQRLEAALPHAIAGGEPELAGRLLWALAATTEPARLGTWLRRFDQRAIAREPNLALTAAVHHLLSGRRDAAGRAIDAAAQHASADPAAVALLRACTARDGLPGMAQDAAEAAARLAPWSPWNALAQLLAGVAAQLAGDHERATGALEAAASRAAELPAAAALARTQLALIAADQNDWDAAGQRIAAAHAAIDAGTPPAVAALVFAVGAFVSAQRGDIAEARHDAADAERRLAKLPELVPWLTAETEIWLARAEILLSDGPAARRLLARAAERQPRVVGDCTLARWIHAGWARADAFAETATGDGPMLTNAELRVLRLLPSHMSFREIGTRLHVSTNTVKTQALSVYRKLDVSCRSDAVERGRAAGLIGGA